MLKVIKDQKVLKPIKEPRTIKEPKAIKEPKEGLKKPNTHFSIKVFTHIRFIIIIIHLNIIKRKTYLTVKCFPCSASRISTPLDQTGGGDQLLPPTLGRYIAIFLYRDYALQILALPVQVVVEVAEVVEGLQNDGEALNTFLLPGKPN